MKKQNQIKESIYFLMPVNPRKRLEKVARNNGVTMSWIVRDLIRQYRRKYKRPPKRKRPRKLSGKHVRFALKLYGDKQEILTFARSRGGEFSSFVREVLELWMEGKLVPNLRTNRSVKKFRRFFLRYKSGEKSVTPLFRAIPGKDFWPKDPLGNLWWMERGLRHRKYPL